MPLNYEPPQSADELRSRFAAGERFFERANLASAKLLSENLRGANLARANLRKAVLRNANLFGANLAGADLARASLYTVNLRDADLRGANLSNAFLGGAELSGADLGDTELSGAELSGADLSDAKCAGARMNAARIGGTLLLNVDLTPFCDADPPVIHRGRSEVNELSIIRSARSPRLKDFLIRTGMPAMFAEYMIDCAKAASGSVFDMMRSTFISYGGPDAAFARKLYEALHRNGVTTFLYEEHAIPGEKIHRTMRKGVNEHDRVVLICSKASLKRKGVLAEIEETREREARDGGASYLIPIRLDSYVHSKAFVKKSPEIAQVLQSRNVANFEGTETDAVKFEIALGRLLQALRKSTPKMLGPEP